MPATDVVDDLVARCVDVLGWSTLVSHTQVLSQDAVVTIGVVRAEERFILKLFPAETCAARLRERRAALRSLVRAGLPVPNVVDCLEVEPHGWLVVTEFVPGEPVTLLSNQEIRTLGECVGRLHAGMRAIEVNAAWMIHASCSLTECHPDAASPGPMMGSLRHGDLHIGNILRQSHGFGFFDFDEMHLGSQLDDLACLLALPDLRSYAKATISLLSGYSSTLHHGCETDGLNGPDLLFAIVRRLSYLGPLQEPDLRHRLTSLAADLADAATAGLGIADWLA